MRTEQLSQEDALECLQKSCEFVCPNDGFLEQLKMFEEMGFKVNRASPIYKRFHLKVLGDSYNHREGIDTSKFGADPGLPTEEASSDVGISENSGRVSSRAYRCKKCRRVVALQENIVDHVPGEGKTSFGWHKRKGSNPFNKCDEVECSSIFVEPLRWMTTGWKTTNMHKIKKMLAFIYRYTFKFDYGHVMLSGRLSMRSNEAILVRSSLEVVGGFWFGFWVSV